MSIDEKLLIRILKILERERPDASNPIPWGKFREYFEDVSTIRLYNHLKYAGRQGYIVCKLKRSQFLTGHYRVVGAVREITPDGEKFVREYKMKLWKFLGNKFNTLMWVIFIAIIAVHAPKLFEISLKLMGIGMYK